MTKFSDKDSDVRVLVCHQCVMFHYSTVVLTWAGRNSPSWSVALDGASSPTSRIWCAKFQTFYATRQ